MAFQFHLAGVLRLRESIEHAEELALNIIIQQMVAAELELKQIEEKQDRLRKQRQNDLVRGLSAAELQEVSEKETQLRRSADLLRSRLRTLEVERVAQLEAYRAARQQVEILTEIREQNYRSYHRAQLRQEQKQLDDLFLSRRRGGN